jgi:transcriptional regulator with XRE-family HTH domain
MSDLKLYRSYSFRDKDPVIDRLRTILDDEQMSYKKVEDASGVSTTTIYNWMRGPTKRPQFCTIAAVAAALGYDVTLQPRRQGHRQINVTKTRGLKLVATK